MQKTGKKLGKRRVFSSQFRKERVREYESGKYTVREISLLYGISYHSVYRWIYNYSAYNKKGLKVVEMTESSTKKVKDLQKRIAELERLLGQKQIKIDYLEEMINLAKEDYQIDIKKNSNTPQSKR
jgi:transposase-like protein